MNDLRDNWLNPYKDQPAGIDVTLKKRTLTNLYNENPTWLQNAHRKLDEAVLAAYGWPVDLSDDDILARLLELNLKRAGQSWHRSESMITAVANEVALRGKKQLLDVEVAFKR